MVCRWWAAAAVILAGTAPAAGADLRKAVKKVLPATVAVEWRATDRDDPPSTNPTAAVKELLNKPEQENPPSASTLEDAAQQHYKAQVTAHVLKTVRVLKTMSADQRPDAVSYATGTIVSADGLIVTLIGETGKGSYSVTFEDGRKVPARLLVDDRRSGLRLLKVDQKGLPCIEVAEKEAELGQQVLAVVCLDMRNRGVGQGIIAATTHENLPGLPCAVLETDVWVGMMSAGAPLADVNGRLVGIVAAKKTDEADGRGPALAVPAEYVPLLLAEAPAGDDSVVVQPGLLGVSIKQSPEPGGSPVVAQAIPETPAVAAGIQEGDEIAAVDGKKVFSPSDVVRRVVRHKPGDQVTVTIRRDGQQQQLKVTLGRRETTPQTAARSSAKIIAGVPGGLYIGTFDKDGKVRVVIPEVDAKSDKEGKVTVEVPKGDAARQQAVQRALEWLAQHQDKAPSVIYAPFPSPATIRVQRSDVEKKLDQLNSDVQSLRSQLEKLIEEVTKLREELEDP